MGKEQERNEEAGGRGERLALALSLVAFFLVGYFGLGLARVSESARDLSTPPDAWLPFVPASVWIYTSAIPMAFAPLLLVRRRTLYRRTIAALAVVIATSLACFALFPVTTAELRPDPASLRGPGSTPWALRLLYALDPPRNAFPSLHLAIGTVIVRAAGRGHPGLGGFGVAWLAALAFSASLVKQHFVVDTAAGLALGEIADRMIVRPATREGAAGGGSRRGALALLGVVALFYAGLWAVYQTGAEPFAPEGQP